jgi:hypothetical protein
MKSAAKALKQSPVNPTSARLAEDTIVAASKIQNRPIPWRAAALLASTRQTNQSPIAVELAPLIDR